MQIDVKLKTAGWLPEEMRQQIIKERNAAAEVNFQFEFDFEDDNDFVICERIWANMNQYQGKVWDALESFLPANRSHTALSVGDEVRIDGRAYRCADFGFELIKEGE